MTHIDTHVLSRRPGANLRSSGVGIISNCESELNVYPSRRGNAGGTIAAWTSTNVVYSASPAGSEDAKHSVNPLLAVDSADPLEFTLDLRSGDGLFEMRKSGRLLYSASKISGVALSNMKWYPACCLDYVDEELVFTFASFTTSKDAAPLPTVPSDVTTERRDAAPSRHFGSATRGCERAAATALRNAASGVVRRLCELAHGCDAQIAEASVRALQGVDFAAQDDPMLAYPPASVTTRVDSFPVC